MSPALDSHRVAGGPGTARDLEQRSVYAPLPECASGLSTLSIAEAPSATGFKPPAPGPARLLQEPLSFLSCSSGMFFCTVVRAMV